MKIMITGASGIVGKELAHQLKKNEKYKIFLLSNSKIKIKNKKDKFTVLKQDLTKPLVFNLKMDTIVHCASKNPLSIPSYIVGGIMPADFLKIQKVIF